MAALGRRRRAPARACRSIPLDSIVGTVDRTREFDRSFRPTIGRVRGRWERIAAGQRRGESLPPISVYRVGEPALRARRPPPRVGRPRARAHDIDAYVTEVETRVPVESGLRPSDLRCKGHERLFFERVPLPARRARAHPPLRPAGLRLAGGGRGGLGHARHAGRASLHGPRGGRARVVRPRVPAGGRDPARRPDCSARRPRPTAYSVLSSSATACCAPTSGARRSRPAGAECAEPPHGADRCSASNRWSLDGVEPQLDLLALGRTLLAASSRATTWPSRPRWGSRAVPASSASSSSSFELTRLRASTEK